MGTTYIPAPAANHTAETVFSSTFYNECLWRTVTYPETARGDEEPYADEDLAVQDDVLGVID